MSLGSDLHAGFGDRARANELLAPHTTLRIGGAADWFVETRSSDELIRVLRLAHRWAVPVTVLGGGSNVLVSDFGVRGVVVHPRHGSVAPVEARVVRAETAVTINGLVRWTVGRGLAGIEVWAGTPGSVGGGVYGNAHFQGRLLSEHVVRVGLVSRVGQELVVDDQEMAFGYDTSRLQTSGEVLLWADFAVAPGDPDALRAIARASLAFRKRTQPLNLPSAGCIFQNPGDEDAMPEGMPRSAGALVDRAGLKGVRMGGARISTVHANFFVNEGGASAADVRALIERARTAVAEQFGVVLREEIVYLGDF